ncbi:MAG TPA: twin-arginine translocation signal domain-containing protein [Usitatibacter sp.]|nr:twin-arginine translocation signal domain-containing protein [Usitatibacter sp.]
MKTRSSTNRRKFLLAAGLGGAGAAAVAIGRVKQHPPQSAQASVEGVEPTGYRSTEHIEKYYKTTKV